MSTFEFLRKGIQKTENSFLWLGPPIGQGQPLSRGPRALLQVHPQSPPSLFGPLVRGALPNRASSTRYTRVPPAGTSLPPLPTAPPRALQLAARPAPSGWLLAPAPIWPFWRSLATHAPVPRLAVATRTRHHWPPLLRTPTPAQTATKGQRSRLTGAVFEATHPGSASHGTLRLQRRTPLVLAAAPDRAPDPPDQHFAPIEPCAYKRGTHTTCPSPRRCLFPLVSATTGLPCPTTAACRCQATSQSSLSCAQVQGIHHASEELSVPLDPPLSHRSATAPVSRLFFSGKRHHRPPLSCRRDSSSPGRLTVFPLMCIGPREPSCLGGALERTGPLSPERHRAGVVDAVSFLR
jgi:hypothetical protein